MPFNFYRKNTICILFILATIAPDKLYSQINIFDPSLENYPNNTSEFSWVECEGSVDLWSANVWLNNPDPSDGLKYIGMVGGVAGYFESISQKLPDTLFQGVSYYFDFDISYLWRPDYDWFDKGKVDIYLGNDVCDVSRKIATCIAQDTIWVTTRVYFTPDADYTSITLRQEYVDTIDINYVLIDNFSAIFQNTLSLAPDTLDNFISVSSIPGFKQISIDVKYPEADKLNFCLYSINGNRLWSYIPLNAGLNTFNMDELPAGEYIVIVEDLFSGRNKSFLVVNI